MTTHILPEYRFPLHLEPTVERVWTLYGEGKGARWEPSRSLDWAGFDRARYEAATLEAARRVWSHHAWRLFGRLTESPALLVRYCLERDRESDPKYFLSMRCTEDAKHVDAAERMARACGGFIAEPSDRDYAAAFNQSLFREALDAAHSLDAYVAAHVAWADGLDAELLRAANAAATDPLARKLLGFLIEDRERQTSFGWMMLAQRAKAWTDADRARIGERLGWVNDRLIASGVLTPWRSRSSAAKDVAAAHAAAIGLGGIGADAAQAAFERYTQSAGERFAALGVAAALR